MKVLIQRVKEASVAIDNKQYSAINKGILALVGIEKGDDLTNIQKMAKKLVNLRIFADENDKMNLSVLDVGGEVLVVSNFTLLANYSHGNRPEYFGAAETGVANELYEYFASLMESQVGHVGRGVFGAHMLIDIQANGPVTIVMDSEKLKKKGKE